MKNEPNRAFFRSYAELNDHLPPEGQIPVRREPAAALGGRDHLRNDVARR